MRHAGTQFRRGFTLFELLLVLALMAIIVSMAAPSFSSFGRGRESEYAGSRLVALCHWARSQAIADGVTYRICLDETGRRWWLEVQNNGAYESVSMPGLPFSLPESVTMSTTVARDNDYAAIVFEPTGRTTTGEVTLTGSKGEPVTITCQNPAGAYTIQQAGEVQR